jgi:MFS transporter, DHA2 family, multidrug resistance protein
MAHPGQTSESNGRWWALAALSLSMLTIGLDATALNVALPTLSTDLGASTSQLQWFGAVYTLVLGALIIPMGTFGDRFGRKRLLLAGMAIFGASSAVCAFAGSAGVLIAARAFQGIGGAAMMPLSLAMLHVLFVDDDERTRAMNIWISSSAIGLPLGPIVAGWLLSHFAWGSVFLINVPVVVAGFLALALYLPESRSEHARALDGPGVALSSTGLVALIYGVIEAGQDGWGGAGVLAPIAAGIVLLAGFLVWERRASQPLIDLALFSNRDFTIGTALSTITNFALFGLLFVMPQYLQDVGGSDPLGTGVRLLPMIGGLIVATRAGPMLVKRSGARSVIIAGLALCAAGMALGATTSVTSPYALAALWIALVGAGIGLTLPAAMATAIGALSMERAGSGSGLIQALRQVGATIGIALLGTVLSSSYHARLDNSADIPPSVERAVRSSVGAGIEVAHRLNSSSLAVTVRSAFVHGMDAVLLASAALTIVAGVIAVLLLPGRLADRPKSTAGAQESAHDPISEPAHDAVAR